MRDKVKEDVVGMCNDECTALVVLKGGTTHVYGTRVLVTHVEIHVCSMCKVGTSFDKKCHPFNRCDFLLR